MTERPNIRRMQVPEAMSEPRAFDANTEISSAKWAEIEEGWRLSLRGESWKTASSYAKDIRILDARRPELTDKAWEKINDILEKERPHTRSRISDDDHLWRSLLQQAAYVHILDPKRTTLDATEKFEVSKLSIPVDEFDSTYIAENRALFKTLYGEEAIATTDADWDLMNQTLNESRDLKSWWEFLVVASNMKILRPRSLSVRGEDWKNMRKDLRDCDEIGEYLERAALMKILAADDIRCSKEKGLEVISQPKLTVPRTNDMPKSFEI